jgi:hypothetical protein
MSSTYEKGLASIASDKVIRRVEGISKRKYL